MNGVADTAMALKSESTYPSRRTFVLKLRSDASCATITGRLENLVTGWQREFASSHELLELVANELGDPPEVWIDMARER